MGPAPLVQPLLHTPDAPGSAELDKVRLRVSFAGKFVQERPRDWKYMGGASILESVPLGFKYSDVVFKLTEKIDGAVTLKYQLPGEELDPDGLISVTDDDDLQEMFEEYFRGLRLPGTPVKTFRLRLFLFPAEEAPFTPEDIIDGQALKTSGRSRSGSRMGATEGKSSLGSNASSGSGLNSVDTDAMELWAEGFIAGQSSAKTAEEPLSGRGESFTPGAHHGGTMTPAGGGTKAMACDFSGAVTLMPDFEMKSPYGCNPRAVTAGGDDGPGSAMRPLCYGDGVPMPRTQDYWYTEPDADAGAGGVPARGSTGLGLPSHISAFGDDQLHRLPSRISVFGDDIDGDDSLHDALTAAGDGLAGANRFADSCRGAAPPGAARPSAAWPPPAPPAAEAAGALAANGGLTKKGSGQGGGGSGGVALQFPNVHRVPRSAVRVLRAVGEGAFGEVSEAETVTFGRVAVKWLKANKMERHGQSFWREAETLSALNHPNVLRFYGVVVEEPAAPLVVGIMTEFMRGGSLSAMLRCSRRYLPLQLRADLALQAACGMAYLHDMAVVHFDLKPDNLLVDGPLEAGGPPPMVKVADFGLSKQRNYSHVSGMSDLRGTLPYMAPELVCDLQHVTEAADVWSFGVCLWEMLTLQVPHAALKPEQILAGLMTGALQLEVPEWCEPEWRGLMEACWELTPGRRPSFRELVRRLQMVREAA